MLKLVGLGVSSAEIAAAPYSAGTAKTHVARLLAKLGARDRVQLVITAYQAGLVKHLRRPVARASPQDAPGIGLVS